MAFFNRKQETLIELPKVIISLIGGSGSGKTSFFQGIQESLVDEIHVIGDGKYNIQLQPISIIPGFSSQENETIKDEEEEIQEVTLEASDSNVLQNSIDELETFGLGGMPAPPPKKSNAPKDSRKVDTYDLHEKTGSDKISEGMQLADYLRKLFGIVRGKDFNGGTATIRYISVTFEVRINGEPKCELLVTDYAGELIDNSATTLKQGVNTLAKHINSSDSAIVLVNARDLSKNVRDVIVPDESMFTKLETKRAVSADNINNLFNILKKDNFTILLAITQVDSPKVDDRVKANDFARTQHDLKEHIFQPTFINASNKNWSTGIIPITVIGRKKDGSPNVDDQGHLLKDAEINQKNADISVLFCLYNSVLCHIMQLQKEIDAFPTVKKIVGSAEEKQHLKTLESQKDMLNQIRNALASNPSIFAKVGHYHSALTTVADTGDVKIVKIGGTV